MNEEIEALIIQAQAGDEVAFSELYERYYRAVFYKIFQLTRNEADAKDLTQEVFLVVQRSLPQLKEPKHFYAWLMMVATTRTKNFFRKHRHDAAFIEDIQEINIPEKRIDANPEYFMQDQSEQALIHSMIAQLPDKYAEVLQLAYVNEMKLHEVAAYLQLPLGTVKTRIVRGRKELKRSIQAFEQQEQRKLSFHLDTALPLSIIGTGWLQSSCEVIVSKLKHFTHTVTSNALMSGCVVSMSVLAVSGSAFLYDDFVIQSRQAPTVQPQVSSNVPAKKQEEKKQEEEQAIVLSQKPFPETTYQKQPVTSSRDAYFICMNFAMKEEDMKQHTKEEWKEIAPIYEGLKQDNSIHYQELQKQGWTELFESYLYGDMGM